MLSHKTMNTEQTVKQSMVTKEMNQSPGILVCSAFGISTYYTAYHNVHLYINSSASHISSPTREDWTTWLSTQCSRIYSMSSGPNSHIHTILPTDVYK